MSTTTTDLGSILNAAIQGGYVAHLAPATYTITEPIVIHVTSTTQGPLGLDGGGATFVSQVTNGQPLIQFVVDPGVDLRYLTLSNFTISGNGQEGDGISIVCKSNDSWVYSWTISDVTVEHVGGYGLDVQGSVFEGIVCDSWMIDNAAGGARFAHSDEGGMASALRWFGGGFEDNGGVGLLLDNGVRDMSVEGASFAGNAGPGISAEWGITSVCSSDFVDNQGAGIWFQNFGGFNDNTFSTSGVQTVGISGYLAGNATLIGNQSTWTGSGSDPTVLANVQGNGGLFLTSDGETVMTGSNVLVSGTGGGNLAHVSIDAQGVTLPAQEAVTEATTAATPDSVGTSAVESALRAAISGGTVAQLSDQNSYTITSPIVINITSSSQAAIGIDLGGAKIFSQIANGGPVIEIIVGPGVNVGDLTLSNFSLYGNGGEGAGIKIVADGADRSIHLSLSHVNIEHVGGIGLDVLGNVRGTVFDSWMHGNVEGGARFAGTAGGGTPDDLEWIGGGFRKNGGAGLILDGGAHDMTVKGAYFVENDGPGIDASSGITLVRNSGFENNLGAGAIVQGSASFVDNTFSTHGPQQVGVGGYLGGGTITLIGDSNEYYGAGADTTVLANVQGSGTLGIAGSGNVIVGPDVTVSGASPVVTPPADTTSPVATSIVASGIGIDAGTGALIAGAAVTLTMTLNEAVTVAGGTPSLVLNDGGTATYTGGSGSTTLTFTHVVQAGQNAADLAVSSLSLNGATIRDAAGNAANLSVATDYNPAGVLKIDTSVPTVSSIAASGSGISAGSGTLSVGKVVTLTMTLSEAVTVAGGTPTLVLNDGGTATYTGGSGTTTLTFSHTVQAGQNVADLAVSSMNLNGATIRDAAGNVANLSAATNLNPAGILRIDTTSPTITSIAASGTGIIAGSGTLDAGKTVTLTMTLGEAVTVSGGVPTLILNDGGTATYTGGSGSATLTFTHTVLAGQNVADLAVSSLSLNGATIRDAAGNAANLSAATNYNPAGILKIDTAPDVTQRLLNDTGASSGDAITSVATLTGTAGANGVVCFTIDGTPIAATATADSSGHWSFSPSGLADGQHTIIASQTDAAGSTGTATLSFTLDTQAPAPIITGGVLSNGQVTLTGSTGTANDTISIYDGYTWLGFSTTGGDGTWSFTAAADPNVAHAYGAIGTDRAGNEARGTTNYDPADVPGIDTPGAPPVVTQALLTDTGASSGDAITSVAALTGTASAHAVVHLTIDGTAAPTTATADANGRWFFTPTGLADGRHTVVASETGADGAVGTASLTITLDTQGPVPLFAGAAQSNGQVTLGGSTGSAGDTLSIYDGYSWLGFATTGSDGTWSFTTAADPNVVHSYGMNASDLAGNEGRGPGKAILGSALADTLTGTSGSDVIAGNGGADILTSGAGNDRFVYTAATESTSAAPDVITDFQHGQDKIDFTNIAGINATNGVAQFQGNITGSGDLTLAAHSVAYVESGGNTLVLVNTSNAAHTVSAADTHEADTQIVLLGVNLGLTSSDILHA